MKREVAEALAAAVADAYKTLDKLDAAISRLDDEAERRSMASALGMVFHHLHVGISLPVARQFPDLHPDVPGSTEY